MRYYWGMKKLVILVVVLAFLCGGVGFGIAKIRQGLTPETTGPIPAIVSSSTMDAVASDHITGQDSLQDLLSLGKTLECSFRAGSEKIQVDGTAFFDNGKVRVDTMYPGASTTVDTTSLIVRDNTLYTWSHTAKGSFAFKMSMTAIPVVTSDKRPEVISLQTDIRYDCKPWHVDGSVFVPPVGMTFTEPGTLSKNLPQQTQKP